MNMHHGTVLIMRSYFDAKYILIIRDPRASIAGSIKYLQRAKRNLSSYDIDLALGFLECINFL